jgi:PhoPQ-activated pathogenicity-related protein
MAFQAVRPVRWLVVLALIALWWGAAAPYSPAQSTDGAAASANPFAAYLAEPDTVYRYEPVRTVEADGHTTYVLRMVSQRWLTDEEVDEPTWWHWVTIIVPDAVAHETGLLWIGGGARDDAAPAQAPAFLVEAARATNTVVTHLHNVPFQPIRFAGDAESPRYEDALIAYGWRQFLEGGARDADAEWLARLPMTKAAMRAMDTVTDYARAERQVDVNQFVVAGASKRGWTTWTTGIFDDRVVGIAPAVIDLLNLRPSFEHHWRAYGRWAPAISEYEEEGIMAWQGSQEYRRLRELVDPYSYRDRLTMPKLIINASGDEFFLPDSWQFYWADLPAPKALRYVPNTGHSLDDTDAHESLIAFHEQVVTDTALPPFDWQVEDQTIRVTTDPDRPPTALRLWSATNPEGRDFRVEVIGRSWTSQSINRTADGQYAISMDAPAEGYTAYFVEATFPGGGTYPITLTSGVVVVPDTYPYPPFEAENPRGTPME